MLGLVKCRVPDTVRVMYGHKRLFPRGGAYMALAFFFLLQVVQLRARSFSVAVYNLENLFDIDGKAVYDEYQPDHYTPAHLRTKLENTSQVVARMVEDGQGPDIIMFQEVELDQTPSEQAPDYDKLLKAHEQESVGQLLSGAVPEDAKDWPAEAWLLKALREHGLKGYAVYAGQDSALQPNEDGRRRAIKNVIFTRLSVKEVRNHPIPNARNIIELKLDVDGYPLYVFSNHWKAGASDPALEKDRVADAQVLRNRLDEILKDDPHADIIVGGDFNSQYNQKQRYPEMRRTGLNDVLRSQGNELAVMGPKADLFNLWFELPEAQRGSDTYRGEWGTLMQLIISRGLFDYNGIQYVQNSFHVVKLPGLNEGADKMPLRWSFDGPAGSGVSDHFPIIARFVTVPNGAKDSWLAIKNPAQGQAPSHALRVKAAVDPVAAAVHPEANANLRDGSFNGKILLVEGTAVKEQRLGVVFRGESWEVYVPDSSTRDRLRSQLKDGQAFRFYGELGQYKGRWQFVIQDRGWLLEPRP